MYPPFSSQGHCTYIPDSSFIMGHSWGCLDAILTSSQYPEKCLGLILINPCLFGHHPLINGKDSSFFYFKRNKTLCFSYIKAAFYPSVVDYSFLQFCNKIFSMNLVGKIAKSFQYYGDLVASKLTFLFEKKIPVLVVLGENDILAPPRLQLLPLQSLAFEIESKIIPKASHMIPLSHPMELSFIIEKFTQHCINKSTKGNLRYSLPRDQST